MVNMHLGYLVDMADIKFTESEDGETFTSTFQAFPYGTYHHPAYGKIEFNAEKASEMAKGVAEKVRGQDLNIDYNHQSHSPDAAGWIKAAEARSDALWLTVDWTKTAAKKIKEKAFRYFSPEFDWKWKHPQTQVVHQNVLFGGGITNRPFLKGILPINLSEFVLDEDITDNHQEEGTGMDPKMQRKLLGLPEDATDEQVTKALADLPDDAVIGSPPKEEPPVVKPEDQPPTADDKAEPIAASDASIAEVIKLAETSKDPVVKALAGALDGLHKQSQIQGAALAMSEAERTVLQLAQPTDGKILTAGVQGLLKAALLNPSQENILKLSEGMLKGGIAPAGEAETAAHEGNPDGDAAVKKFHDAVEAKVNASNDKLDFNEATEIVAAEKPELYAEYRAAAYSFVEDRT